MFLTYRGYVNSGTTLFLNYLAIINSLGSIGIVYSYLNLGLITEPTDTTYYYYRFSCITQK